jgi:PTH1 family peptidyl-tRNA hydrolase
MVVDNLAAGLSCRLRRSFRFHAAVGKAFHSGAWLFLAKPRTYMNNSGSAVAAVLKYHKLWREDLMVVVDDADLPLGRMRIRGGGGSGGHKGLQSVIEAVGGRDFARLRVGVGREQDGGPLTDHVLTPLSGGEQRLMAAVAARAAEAVMYAVDSGVEAAMNSFNGIVVSDGNTVVAGARAPGW